MDSNFQFLDLCQAFFTQLRCLEPQAGFDDRQRQIYRPRARPAPAMIPLLVKAYASAIIACTRSTRTGSRKTLRGLMRCCTSRICWWTAGSAAVSRLRAPEFEHAVQIGWTSPFDLRKSEIRNCGRRQRRLDQPRPRRQFGRHHSPYHVARSGLPWCHIDKLRIGVLSRLGGSLQYPSRGHETRIGGDAFAFARDGEDQTAYWEEQMPWRLWVAVSAGTFATKSLAILWHSTYAIAENARSSQLLRLACPSKLNVPIFTPHEERPARGLAAQIAAIV